MGHFDRKDDRVTGGVDKRQIIFRIVVGERTVKFAVGIGKAFSVKGNSGYGIKVLIGFGEFLKRTEGGLLKLKKLDRVGNELGDFIG